MKIQEKKADLVPFSSIELGGVFRYKMSIAIKIYTLVSDFGNVKAISLEDGRHYTFSFDDESTLVEPLDATLVINWEE